MHIALGMIQATNCKRLQIWRNVPYRPSLMPCSDCGDQKSRSIGLAERERKEKGEKNRFSDYALVAA